MRKGGSPNSNCQEPCYSHVSLWIVGSLWSEQRIALLVNFLRRKNENVFFQATEGRVGGGGREGEKEKVSRAATAPKIGKN